MGIVPTHAASLAIGPSPASLNVKAEGGTRLPLMILHSMGEMNFPIRDGYQSLGYGTSIGVYISDRVGKG